HAREWRHQAFFHFYQKPLQTHSIQHVLEARALAVGAIALVDEDPHDRHRHRNSLLGRDQHAEIAGEIAMPGDAADRSAEVNTVRLRLARPDAYCGEADVVGIFEGGDSAAAVEGDIEFARQAVELAVVEDRVIQIQAERPRVVELQRIDAGGRVPGDVSDIVRARAARSEAG